jgi:RNA polymerase sigma-70 factor (ECF subfamily)
MWLFGVVSVVAGDSRGSVLDRDIVQRMSDGDAEALGALYDRHARSMYSLALRIVRDRAAAEDVLQETFAQIWRQAARFDVNRGSVVGWLLTVTRSRALDRLRRARVSLPTADPELVARELPDQAPGVEVELLSAEQAARVREALAALGDDQRVPLELGYYEGLSQSEIAAKLGVPLGTIKTRMRQALRRLREALGANGHD